MDALRQSKDERIKVLELDNNDLSTRMEEAQKFLEEKESYQQQISELTAAVK